MEDVGWWKAERDDFKRRYWSGVEIPTRIQIFFSLIFVYKLTSTNIYNTNCIVQIHTIFYMNCIVRIRIRCGFCTNSYNFLYELYSTNSYNEPQGQSPSREGEARAARAKPEHTSCPDQAAPSCPDVRVHPAAPTFRVHPAAPTLGYTRLPRPVRVRSWGGWVRNGIKITIRKSGLYDLTRMAYYSQPLAMKYFTILYIHVCHNIVC
jgi:hypothetical protein